MNTSPPSPCETDTTNPLSRNVKNHIKNDLSKSYLAKKSPKIHQKTIATTDYQAVAIKFCDPVGIRTQDPQLRRLLLYPAELRDPDSSLPRRTVHQGSCTCQAGREFGDCKGNTILPFVKIKKTRAPSGRGVLATCISRAAAPWWQHRARRARATASRPA